ncbi:MAG: hypothetical protein AMJ53_05410 [Gammaproteobacteria bacterium SG8_11]|nr:MAG: hypothetical protein AMJ53_05410 [Gammaproteobacteria bacterium SG8_11]
MTVPIAIALHLITSTIWVGGMFFAYMALRPVAAEILEPPVRLELWLQTFKRFFLWVWLAVILLPLSGYWMIMQIWGGFSSIGLDLKLMHVIGWVMILIFMLVYFVPYRRMRHALAKSDLASAANALALIRKLVALNLTLGLITVVIASAGRYL